MNAKWLVTVAAGAAALAPVGLEAQGTGAAISSDGYTILVGEPESSAFEFARSVASDETIFAERRLHRALTRASQLLADSGPQTVRVLVASGKFPGKTGQGVWEVPAVQNPEGRLYILGGFNDQFNERRPFETITELVTQPGRPGAFLQFGQRSQLAEVVISGLVFDAAPSNVYDDETNSILKGQSRTYGLISFSQLRLDHLVVADNVFINGAHGAFDPYITPGPSGAVVDIQNNLFMNTIKTMQPAATGGGGDAVVINLRHNSFIMNWPYNPDATSSNVGALELYHRDGAQSLTIEGNLFAFNVGGAMQHDWPEERMPPIVIRNNLFFSNGSLFDGFGDEAGVIVGKFGLNPRHLSLDLETVKYDLGYDVEGNVSFDPEIAVQVAPLLAVDSDGVERDDTVLNDVRRILGLNQSGSAVPIANYAPRLTFNPDVPSWLPKNEAGKAYGVQPDRVWTGN